MTVNDSLIVAIESDPGSNVGSYFISNLSGDKNIKYHREPLYNWKYYPLLEKFWKEITQENIQNNSIFIVLIKSIFDKYNRIVNVSNSNNNFYRKKVDIFERSIFSDFYVFVNSLRTYKKLNDIEYEIIKSLFRYFESKTSIMNYFFYIKTVPSDRIIQGSRVSSEFIKLYQNNVLNFFEMGNKNCKVYNWDGTEEQMQKIINSIKNIIESNYKKF